MNAQAEIAEMFAPMAVTPDGANALMEIRHAFTALSKKLEQATGTPIGKSREMALVATHLQTASFYAIRAAAMKHRKEGD